MPNQIHRPHLSPAVAHLQNANAPAHANAHANANANVAGGAQQPQPLRHVVADPVETAAAAKAAHAAKATNGANDAEKAGNRWDRFLGGVAHVADRAELLVERRFIRPHDGFMALDTQGRFVAGVSPSAVERDTPKFRSPLNAMLGIFAGEEHKKQLTFSVGSTHIAGSKSHREAEMSADLAGDLGKAISGAVHPKHGGLVDVTVSSEDNTKPALARVLALPRNYNGPILVSDIDDTLRDTSITKVLTGETQKTIAGAKEIVEGAASMGVPVVYLSAGTSAIHEVNTRFLEQLPAGILLDNLDLSLTGVITDNSPLDQAAYKTAVLQKIRDTYPNAKIFGFGDDKYGDAIAYTRVGAKAYIHDVKPDDANIPSNFVGVKTREYDAAFQQKILADMRAAIPQD